MQSIVPDQKRRALGKGLESLLPARSAPLPKVEASTGQPLELSTEQIDRNPFQTRTHFDEEKLKELAQSIASSGVVQPIVVKPLPGNRYQLITGERRLLASRMAGKLLIPAIVREVSDEQAMEMTIIENLQREDLNPIEQAKAYQRLSTDFHMTQEQMSTRTGKERATIANFLRLLKLPQEIQWQVEAGTLSFGHAKLLLAVEGHDQVMGAARKMVALAMSVRQAETFVRGLMYPEARPSRIAKAKIAEEAQDPNVQEAQTRLQRALGLRVRIEDKSGRGRVIIEYGSLEDFDLLVDALASEQDL